MKRFQSILCASFLTLAISATALAGDIHTIAAPRTGDIHTIVRSILMFVAAIG